MFTLVTDASIQRRGARQFERTFSEGSTLVRQTLSTPSAKIEGAEVLVREDLGIWCHFGRNDRMLYMVFGAGVPDFHMGIQLNVTLGRSWATNGQLVADDQGALFIAHKGALGGGKYSVKIASFERQISGFDKVDIQDGHACRAMYVLGDVSEPGDLHYVASFVRQAQQIREVRRALEPTEGDEPEDEPTDEATFVPEPTKPGSYVRNGVVLFDRRHGRIHEALAALLRDQGYEVSNRALDGGIKPDLLAVRRSRKRTILFEIKTTRDAQSHFTAIGQLLVYQTGCGDGVAKVLVTLGLPSSRLFRECLASMDISVFECSLIGQRVEFPGLQDYLALAAS